ncbi:related to PUB1 - major polyadenylated RNA-binding protein of nucleus and cytoplasm [Melanopsichium pennsylvanicum]|uniref:Related to PUB1 - major polyadenylated RNA-binding protein of nucleus and cytoplasm n=2 Tax=Melanopsichium pennsylvanicum TaxID=63383 RepID=A0AAJ4XJ04_9BASI|nr:related to PUB1-major polyadenylated RNA-binding protein of nucleus and cytoplasm [Melanopsichium pennsylvanicum 4]SNX82571.1 related to PUB1 - major polyadenylated RNA-binding protein of nucleus and cytoplasm [Melanopsichium pennsylvanicum]
MTMAPFGAYTGLGPPSGSSSRRVDMSTTVRPLVHIANLPVSTTERNIREMFSSLGQIQSVKVVTSRSAGALVYGFVEYVDVASAERAIRTMDGWLWFGTPIKVSWAKHSMHPDAVAEEDTERPLATQGNASNSHLFVGDLAPEVDDSMLQSFFSRFSSLADVRVMYDAETGKSRGFGFISLRQKQDAERCIITMHGQWLGGRQVRVNWANQKNQNQATTTTSTNLSNSLKPPSQHSSNSYFDAKTQLLEMAAFALPTVPRLPRRHTAVDHTRTIANNLSRKFNYDEIVSAAPPTQTSVYVGNISPLTSESDLVRIFAPFNHGHPLEARIPHGRGYGFVTLASHEKAASAICTLSIQGVFMHSRWLRFGWQNDREKVKAQGKGRMPPRSE